MRRLRLFGTTGIRGKVNKLLTPEFASKIASSFATYLKGEGDLLVCSDVRESSPMLKSAVISGLLSSGCNVYDGGVLPSPAAHYIVKSESFNGGIIVTGSHVPAEMNGLKFLLGNGFEVHKEEEAKIEEIYFEEKINRGTSIGALRTLNGKRRYREFLTKQMRSEGLKIVVDARRTAQRKIIPEVLREQHQIISLTSEGKGRGYEPKPEELEELGNIVKKKGADLGVAYDGDGDRAIFCTDEGEIIMGDISGSLITKYLFSQGKIVTPVNTSSVIDMVAEDVIRTKVGATYVIRTILEQEADFGFEENGGCIFLDLNPCRDGGLTTVKMLEVLSQVEKKLSSLVDALPKFHTIKEAVHCPSEKKEKVIKRIAKRVKKEYDKYNTMDGIKIKLPEEGWMLIRPSGTEPVIRCFSESKSEEKAREIVEKGLEIIKRAL